MAGSSRLLIGSISLIAAWNAHAAFAQTRDTIIWNDPPAKSDPAPADTSSGAPIRDDYAQSKTLVPPPTSAPPRTGNQSITWSEPSMPPKDKVGKINTSSSTGPCREFQQNVIIDGKRQKAHGTACRQPDGSWRITN